MDFQISFRPYRRSFLRPLRTAHGQWAERRGFIVRVEYCTGAVSYGEIAPIPEFGSESVGQAEALLSAVEKCPELAMEGTDLPGHPCCAFALGCALRPLEGSALRDYTLAGLLPAGLPALEVLVQKVQRGYQDFKWKIGVESPAREQGVFERLIQALPAGGRIRLDANGGLSRSALKQWIHFLQPFADRIEYVEQPLPPGQEAVMAALTKESGIAIGLDESLNGKEGRRWLKPGAWEGPLIVKPALMGDPRALLERLRASANRVVFSSVFETAIGVENALCLADALPGPASLLGFDTQDAFKDDFNGSGHSGPQISARLRTSRVKCFESLWKRLPL